VLLTQRPGDRTQGQGYAPGAYAGDGLRGEGDKPRARRYGVLFYSDGLVEAHNPQGEMFGFPRLRKLISVRGTEGAARSLSACCWVSWSGSQARTGGKKMISRWCPCRGRCARIRSLYKTETQSHVADDSIAGKLSRKSNHEPDRHEPRTVWRQTRRTSANPRFEHLACLGGFANVSERRRISSQDRDSGARARSLSVTFANPAPLRGAIR
jgi:hypothetical protein